MLPVEQPFKIYTGLDGKPLDNGFIWFGQPNQNPQTSPVTVYWDPEGTIPAAQPLRTVNGYIYRAGTPANVYFDGDYSELIWDSRRRQVSFAKTSQSFSIASYVGSFVSKLAGAVGAALIGFSQGASGSVPLTIQDVLRESVSVARFGAVGDGIHDDTAAIQAAIDSFPNASSCSVRFLPGKTYNVTAPLDTHNRSVILDGQNAIISISKDADCVIKLSGTNCEVANMQINRTSGAKVTCAIRATGLQHVFRNITSRAQTWPIFFLNQDLKESHFTQIRVDNDVTGFTGIVWQFDYSVNNTISDSMVGYCAKAVYGSSAPQPTSGYHNEGILINNLITVYAAQAVNFDNGTFIAISNSLFDFCENIGVFISNGNNLSMSNVWIASNTTNNFLGVGTLPQVYGVRLQNIVVNRGAGPITGTAAVSLPGPGAMVMGIHCQNGMNGGVVTQSNSQVIGFIVDAPGTPVNANNTQAHIGGKLIVDLDLSVGGSEGIFPEGLSGSATAGGNGAPPATVAGYATFTIGSDRYKLPYYLP